MATQQQRSELTKALLLKTFRQAFLERGFNATTTEYVLDQTGLSKGAMYHHFRGKTEVAEALFAEEAQRALHSAMESVDPDDPPLEQLKTALLTWAEGVRTPSVSKILFEVGPSALGPQKAKEIEDAISLQYMEDLLVRAISAGDLHSREPKLMAAFLNALVAEAALHALRTKKDTSKTLAHAIDGLFRAFQ